MLELPRLPGLSLKKLATRSIKKYINDEMTTYASALAYSAFFALFPFMLFLVALLSVLHLTSFFDWFLEQARLIVPPAAMGRITEVVEDTRQQAQEEALPPQQRSTNTQSVTAD